MPFLLPQPAPGGPTIPDAPSIGTASAGNTSASVAFTPNGNGGSAILDFTATSTPGSITGTGSSSPVTVNGLTNGQPYTFTVHARNAIGNSAESGASNSVTPTANLPAAPTNVQAYADQGSLYCIFTAPTSNGGSALTQYKANAYTTPGNVLSGTPVTIGVNTTMNGLTCYGRINGLSAGTNYVIRVKATNVNGDGPESANSNTVAPTTPGNPYYICNGNSPSSSQPQNAGWLQYDVGTVIWNSTGQVFGGQTNSVSVAAAAGAQPAYRDPQVTVISGDFNLSPFTNVVIKIYPTTTGGFIFKTRYHRALYGTCTSGSGSNLITDASANWTTNSMAISNTSMNYVDGGNFYGTGGMTNTATTVSVSSRTWSAGDHYQWGNSDNDYTPSPDVALAQYVTSPNAGSFTANQWNTVVCPVSALPSVNGTTGAVPGVLQEITLWNQTAAIAYLTDWGFAP
jgi:hypothetical protein